MTGDVEITGAIKSLARRHVPDVLAEAVRLAKAQATEELAMVFAKAMVAESMVQAGAVPDQGDRKDGADRGLCAYAITRDRQWERVDFPQLHTPSSPRVIIQGGLGLVVADVDIKTFSGLDVDTAESGKLAMLAREHDAVVRTAFEHETVLPLRFGTIVNDEDAARQLLVSRYDEVTNWLDHVDGHREWGIRVEQIEGGEPPEIVPEGLSGTDYLRQRSIAVQWRENRQTAVDSLYNGLTDRATDAVRREHRPQMLLDAAYLVPRENEKLFHAEVDRLGSSMEKLGMSVQSTGPWPPYSFTRLELAVAQ